jgi:hypothetical protein
MSILNDVPCGGFALPTSTEHEKPPRNVLLSLKFNLTFEMRLFGFPAAVLALAGAVQSVALEKLDLLTDLQEQVMENLKAAEANGTLEKRGPCNIFNAAVRRDWYD